MITNMVNLASRQESSPDSPLELHQEQADQAEVRTRMTVVQETKTTTVARVIETTTVVQGIETTIGASPIMQRLPDIKDMPSPRLHDPIAANQSPYITTIMTIITIATESFTWIDITTTIVARVGFSLAQVATADPITTEPHMVPDSMIRTL